MQKKEVTIYDLARKLRLSTATISRGLNDDPLVSKKTRKTIMDIATQMGYQRNMFASNLRSQQTNMIGVMVHELNSYFITSALAGIERVLAEAGYSTIIAHSAEQYEKETANALTLFHKRVDGLIASLSFNTKDLDHFHRFDEKGIPVVFFDRVEESSHYTHVVIDNYQCGYDATKHLIDQGCKKIVLVTADLSRNVYAQRHRGYRAALADHGIPYHKDHVLLKDLSEASGIDAALHILNLLEQPDGLFFTNDFPAAVCLQLLREKGLRIPQDIAVVGFNDDPVCKIVEPNLTTVRYPGTDVGELAARSLVHHLTGVSSLSQTTRIIARSELIVRQSSLRKG